MLQYFQFVFSKKKNMQKLLSKKQAQSETILLFYKQVSFCPYDILT